MDRNKTKEELLQELTKIRKQLREIDELLFKNTKTKNLTPVFS